MSLFTDLGERDPTPEELAGIELRKRQVQSTKKFKDRNAAVGSGTPWTVPMVRVSELGGVGAGWLDDLAEGDIWLEGDD